MFFNEKVSFLLIRELESESEAQIDTIESKSEVETTSLATEVVKIESDYPDSLSSRSLSPQPNSNSSKYAENQATVQAAENIKSHESNAIEIKSENIEPQYSCETCAETFDDLNIFEEHLKQHDREKNAHTCNVCGKTFSLVHNLRNHENVVHLGIRPFECQECGRCFSFAAGLKLHVHTHKPGKRSCKCIKCGKGFYTKNDLQHHLSTHASQEFGK